MQEPFHGVPRGRKRDAYDNWVEAQEQVARRPPVKYHGSSAHAEALASASDGGADLPFVEVNDFGSETVADLTDEVRAALAADSVVLRTA